MIIFKHSSDLQNFLKTDIDSSSKIGFVPTMGALHRGHLSLLAKSKEFSDISICSIFINPVQFNNPTDFKKYPKTIESDILLLEENGCDILFLPSEIEIYPEEESRNKHYDLGRLETILEGEFRPGHFQGVCLVVDRLLSIIDPDTIFLGQKDFQQCIVIERLIQLTKRKTKVVICPIVRESSGLAMSSRNLRLTEVERDSAAELHAALVFIKDQLTGNNFSSLKQKVISDLGKKGFAVEYLELASINNLKLISEFATGDESVLLIAAFLNEVRLIDNLLIKV
ncbi:MAG TPA: pantoate--beta-alanine ligase [Hanamia sp.]